MNTSVTFTKKQEQKTGININLSYVGDGVKLTSLTISMNGKSVNQGFNEVPPGSYTISVSAKGTDDQGNYIIYRVLFGNPKTFTVSKGAITEANFTLQANGISN